MRYKNIHFGKQIENNLIKSLSMAGIEYGKSLELDHNDKIDFTLYLNKQQYGIQLSLKNCKTKAIIARICALDVVPRFIYLNLAKEFFANPSKEKAVFLYNALTDITKKYTHNALYIKINKNGFDIKKI